MEYVYNYIAIGIHCATQSFIGYCSYIETTIFCSVFSSMLSTQASALLFLHVLIAFLVKNVVLVRLTLTPRTTSLTVDAETNMVHGLEVLLEVLLIFPPISPAS